MNKFDGILICTDLDGTLIKNDGSISEENLQAIEYFKQNGGLFTFVTGRMPVTSQKYLDTVKPNAPVGCINGGGLYDYDKKCFLETTELNKSAFEIIKCVDENLDGISVQINTPGPLYYYKDNPAMVNFRKREDTAYNPCHYNDIKETVLKCIFAEDDEERMQKIMHLATSHPLANEFDFIRSQTDLFEILPKGVNKSKSIIKLEKYLGIKNKNIIAAGDYYNDIEMLKAAGLGIAVKNARDEVKKAADYVLDVTNEEHAIAKIIELLEKGQLQ